MGAQHSIDRRTLAAALNAIEADGDDAATAIEEAWQRAKGVVVGITGPPGVGKSTLAGRLVAAWRARALSVAALCIDPSSKKTGGALLGDRLRMRLSGDDPDVFVRSLAARGQLGGLAPRAFEATTVMRAAADRVLVETVGVGQSEIDVSLLADVTVVVIQPGSGDALQFLKAGLMEVFDVLVVNKADLGVLAENAARELRSALRVLGHREVPIVTLSAEQNTGVDALMTVLEAAVKDAAALREKREAALRETVLERYASWHGEKAVKAAGGRAALRAKLAAEVASPARLKAVLEPGAPASPYIKGSLPQSAAAKPWVAEVEVDQATARALVATVAPELAEVVPEPLGSGWDNTAWLFRLEDDAWVFRFPRRQLAVAFLERELAVLPEIARRVPLPVTAARWRGVMANGWPFGGYRFLTGEMAAIARLTDREKVLLAPAWAAFVRALHAIDPQGSGAPELPIDPLGKVDVARRWDVTIASLTATGAIDAGVIRVLERAREVWSTSAPRPHVVCHGDLDGRHLIVARAGDEITASGVIDWGDVMLGDPAIDLGLAFSLLDGAARAAFFEVYGEIDPATEALARFRAVASQVWVLSWARDTGHAEHGAEARRALLRASRE